MQTDSQVHVFIDFETRSQVDLKKSGLTKYAKDQSTDVLCLGWQLENMHTAEIWTPYQSASIPLPFMAHKRIKYYAWNAAFELAIWNHVMVKRYNFPPMDLHQIVDVQAMAIYLNFPVSLENCCQYLFDTGKDITGKMLI